MSEIPKAVSEYMKKIGRKGGQNGKGASKTRSASHYQKMVRARRKKS